MGDLLFARANLARHVGADLEALLAAGGRAPEQASLGEMDRLWDRARSEG